MLHRIADFGRAALQLDPQTTRLPEPAWDRLENIDIESGDIRSKFGETLISDACPIDPLYSFVYEGAEITALVISDGDSIFTFDGTGWQDITPVTGSPLSDEWDNGPAVNWNGDASLWYDEPGTSPVLLGGIVTFDVFLGTLIVNFSEGTPYTWDGLGRLEPLPGWPVNWNAQSIVSYRNFLVAIGCYTGGLAYAKYTVCWSDAAASGELPQTWQAAPENLAGLVQLRDTDGYLVVAKALRDDLIVYKNDCIYRMFYRGDEFVMGFEKMISDRGCDSYRGVDELDGVHFFADRGDIRVFDGQSTQSVAIDKIKQALASAISNTARDQTAVVAYPERDEVWVGVVPVGQVHINPMLTFSTVYQAWTLKWYDNVVSVTLGPFSATYDGQDITWDSEVGSWESTEDSWNESVYEPSEDGIILGNDYREMARVDKSSTDAHGEPLKCVAERTGFVIPDIGNHVTVKGVYPEMEGSGTVQIAVGASYLKGGVIRWTKPQDFRIGIDRDIKVRVTGQPTAFSVSATSARGWRLGAMSFDIVEAGRR